MSQKRNYSELIAQATGAKKQLVKSLDACTLAHKQLTRKLQYVEKAQAFLQKVAQETQEQLKIHVEDIVQLALDAIFPDRYTFEIQFTISYGKTIAELVFISKQTGHMVDPMIASGGGVVDVCSFALRLACWTLSRDVDKVIILDEPFRFLSKNLQERAGQLLKELSGKLNIQIILTTHLDALIDAADKTINVMLDKLGVSQIAYG
ncbi:MAG: AAA family ATPase [Endomicrobium sp.]|jgi:DNA repair exonuclease SbcCD ATPase subunit|nr:AAA family ATPase [Endomicrobium sp.]